jgi:hypothetical protein
MDKSSATDIVRAASQYKRGDPKRGIDPDRYDEVWAVFDWDQNTEQVEKALIAAKRADVNVALSNPSFEIWLLWHFADYTRPGCVQRDVLKELRRYWADFGKGSDLDFNRLPDHSAPDAIDRANRAAERHRRQGTGFPDDRPSSRMAELLTRIVDAWQKGSGQSRDSCPLF